MEVRIDKDLCTGCGLCVDTSPDVFELENESAKVKVTEIPDDQIELVREAADNCPVEAIMIRE